MSSRRNRPDRSMLVIQRAHDGYTWMKPVPPSVRSDDLARQYHSRKVGYFVCRLNVRLKGNRCG